MDKQPIDFVVTWVNDRDADWHEAKVKALEREGRIGSLQGTKSVRFQDFGLLRYWFRGIEKYASWVRNIYLVLASSSQLPDWLNVECNNLRIVYHRDFIDEKYLPTFNSHVIEWNLHKIEGLSEQFLYFNDDVYLCDYVTRSDFFDNEKLREAFIMMAIQPSDLFTQILFNNTAVLNKHFSKRQVIRENLLKIFTPKYGLAFFKNILCLPWTYFTGFQTLHSVYPLTISYMEKVWEIERELLEKVCSHKFRHEEDVNLYLVGQFAMLSGEFSPRKTRELRYYYNIVDDTGYKQALQNRKYKVICLNDNVKQEDFDRTTQQLKEAFELSFPNHSKYEIKQKGRI